MSSRCVNTYNFLNFTLTLGELAVLCSGRHVVGTTNEIIGILAVVWGSDRVEASLEAELVSTDECVPVEHLRERMAIRISSAIREYNTSKRVALEIGTVRVKFAALVSGIQSNASVFDETDSLNVPLGFGPLQSGDGTRRNETSTMVGLGAVSYNFSFDVADKATRVRGSPQAKVIRSVEDQCLAV